MAIIKEKEYQLGCALKTDNILQLIPDRPSRNYKVTCITAEESNKFRTGKMKRWYLGNVLNEYHTFSEMDLMLRELIKSVECVLDRMASDSKINNLSCYIHSAVKFNVTTSKYDIVCLVKLDDYDPVGESRQYHTQLNQRAFLDIRKCMNVTDRSTLLKTVDEYHAKGANVCMILDVISNEIQLMMKAMYFEGAKV